MPSCPSTPSHPIATALQKVTFSPASPSGKFDAFAILNSTGKPQALKRNQRTAKGVDFENK
jgi:hypothetical protein